MSFSVIIPARYRSTRFPGKALVDLAGKPMVVRVCDRAAKSGAARIVVATDDRRIRDAVEAAGYRALMTRADHRSGTDRIAEAAARLGLGPNEIVVNVQGDEPLIPPRLISQVAETLRRRRAASLSTACHVIGHPSELANPNVVKVVLDREGYALYFSRAGIPYPRDRKPTVYRHIGIYGYRASFLKAFPRLEIPELEKCEALEQLRALWHGYRIAVAVIRAEIPPGIDTPQQLRAVRRML